MNGSSADAIQASFADIWKRSLPLIYRRIAAIEQAAAEMAKPSPNLERIDLGRSEAHKLVGVLGTFGLTKGTGLARSLEERLGSERVGDPADLMQLATRLRSLVDGALANPGVEDARSRDEGL